MKIPNIFSPMRCNCEGFGVSNSSVALILIKILKFKILLYRAQNLYSCAEIAFSGRQLNSYNFRCRYFLGMVIVRQPISHQCGCIYVVKSKFCRYNKICKSGDGWMCDANFEVRRWSKYRFSTISSKIYDQ